MFENRKQNVDIFNQGIQSVQRGLWTFGAALVTLALLIFVFPALIGILFAGFILAAGIAVLILGYRFWQMRKHIREWEVSGTPKVATFKTEGPHYAYRRFTIVMR
jgi:hypothetical protein